MRKINIVLILFILGLSFAVQNYEVTQVINPQFNTGDFSIPKSINFQGYLYRDGNPMDTTMNMWFGIFDDPSVGNQLFQQAINNVVVTKGWFTVTLDDMPNLVFPTTGPTRYLEVKAPSTGPALLPRISMVSVGYSYHALNADTAEYSRIAPLTRPITPPLSGTEIAKPCTLSTSVSSPNAVLRIKNTGAGNAISIDSAGSNGIYINRTGSNGVSINRVGSDGLNISRAGSDGVQVDSAAYYGVRILRTGYDGAWISRAGDNGVQIDSAGNDGFYIARAGEDGVSVFRAGNDGVNVDSVGKVGFYVNRADTGVKVRRARIGVYVDSAGSHGIYVYRAEEDGIYVDRAENTGVNVLGMNAGGLFLAGRAETEGLLASSFGGVSTDTAIKAYGRGYATGGWYTGGLLGNKEAPCLISPELGIIAAGTGKLSNGKAEISFDPMLVENIRTDIPVRITVTPRGKPAGFIYITESKTTGFKVELMPVTGLENNSMDVTFDWIAFATLKEYETSPEAKAEWEKAMKEREERRNRHSDMR